MHADGFNLTALRADFEYVTAKSLCCPMTPDEAEEKYENDLLKVKIPFKDPLEDMLKYR